jgi:hypothetical protein
MRQPRGTRDAVVFAALVLAGYVLMRSIGIGEPFAFILTAIIALAGWSLVSRRST